MGGEVNYWDDVDLNRMSILILWMPLRQLGYLNYENVYYLFPRKSLDDGLMHLKIDQIV